MSVALGYMTKFNTEFGYHCVYEHHFRVCLCQVNVNLLVFVICLLVCIIAQCADVMV